MASSRGDSSHPSDEPTKISSDQPPSPTSSSVPVNPDQTSSAAGALSPAISPSNTSDAPANSSFGSSLQSAPAHKKLAHKQRASPSLRPASPAVNPSSPLIRPSELPALIPTTSHPGGVRMRRNGSNHSEQRKSSRVIVFSADDDEAELEADYEREHQIDLADVHKGLKVGRRLRSKGVSVSGAVGSPSSSKRGSTSAAAVVAAAAGSSPVRGSSFTKSIETSTETQATSSSLTTTVQQKQKRASITTEPIPEVGDELENNGEEFPLPLERGPSEVSTGALSHKSRFGALLHEIGQSKDNHDVKKMQRLEEDLLEDFEEQDEEDEEEDNDDAASVSSTETFTLRERQDAINITHPFGIRIWKPAVYKKIRSVQRFAEGEIHSGPNKDISYLVWLGNIIWSVTFGFLLLIIAWTGAFLLRAFFFWSRSATIYSRTFFNIGKYLIFPFGICVQLNSDKNYLLEDEGEGRTISEYQEWQTVDSRRLFFDTSANRTPSQEDPQGSDTAAEHSPRSRSESSGESSVNTPEFQRKLRFFGRGDWSLGRVLFFFWFYISLYPVLLLVSLICWLGVFSIPMGKITMLLSYHLRRHPLALSFRPSSTLKNLPPTEYESSILLCTYRALGSRYYKYTIDGTNIFFINLMALVAFVIVDYYTFESLGFGGIVVSPTFIFGTSMLSIVPLAYFIGQAVASISAQSSMGMGATINAFFSTVVEVFLYCVALSRGKGDLVEGSIVGSIFGGILLLPGFSMCAGAIKRKTQRYNPKSAGVSSTMLLFAIIGAFAPTIFYQIYGTYELRCTDCELEYVKALSLDTSEDCQRCHFYQAPITTDSLYSDIIKPFSSICASLLFISYVIGLWFTLRTHAAMIWQTPTSSELHSQVIPHGHAPQSILPLTHDPHTSGTTSTEATSSSTAPATTSATIRSNRGAKVSAESGHKGHEDHSAAVVAQVAEGGGHDAPNWSRTKSTVILLGATVLYAIIAEILVGTVDGVLKSVNISEKFVGVTIFALVPNTTEFLNAISFAMNGNIALSMEIGSAYVLQVCLLQIPALVLYTYLSAPLFPDLTDFMFTLIFPRWDLLMVIFCVFVFSYIYAEGKSNYFKGSILVLSYLVVMAGFYFTGSTAEAGISQLSASFRMISKGGTKVLPM